MVKELVAGRQENDELTPWEQHSAVISIPRFDYNVPAAIAERSHSGFLVTCTIKREKSATKEAIAILEKHLHISSSDGMEKLEPLNADFAAKKRKICHSSEEIGGEDTKSKESREPGEVAKETLPISATIDTCLSLVKLTGSGLLLFTFPRNDSPETIEILSKIFHSLDSRDLKPPTWCHRILPIQATCCLMESDLRIVVSKLVHNYLDNVQDPVERPIKFAVGFNRRGIDEMAVKNQKTISKDSSASALLDRNECLHVVAGAVKDVAPDSVVDLKSPKMVVLVEVLPLSGVPTGSLVAAVAVLPHNLINTKPRLCVKPLVFEAKTTKRN